VPTDKTEYDAWKGEEMSLSTADFPYKSFKHRNNAYITYVFNVTKSKQSFLECNEEAIRDFVREFLTVTKKTQGDRAVLAIHFGQGRGEQYIDLWKRLIGAVASDEHLIPGVTYYSIGLDHPSKDFSLAYTRIKNLSDSDRDGLEDAYQIVLNELEHSIEKERKEILLAQHDNWGLYIASLTLLMASWRSANSAPEDLFREILAELPNIGCHISEDLGRLESQLDSMVKQQTIPSEADFINVEAECSRILSALDGIRSDLLSSEKRKPF
jgi:hypothetical protein